MPLSSLPVLLAGAAFLVFSAFFNKAIKLLLGAFYYVLVSAVFRYKDVHIARYLFSK
jgi:predicted membrane-bound mannosyltransferase